MNLLRTYIILVPWLMSSLLMSSCRHMFTSQLLTDPRLPLPFLPHLITLLASESPPNHSPRPPAAGSSPAASLPTASRAKASPGQAPGGTHLCQLAMRQVLPLWGSPSFVCSADTRQQICERGSSPHLGSRGGESPGGCLPVSNLCFFELLPSEAPIGSSQ